MHRLQIMQFTGLEAASLCQHMHGMTLHQIDLPYLICKQGAAMSCHVSPAAMRSITIWMSSSMVVQAQQVLCLKVWNRPGTLRRNPGTPAACEKLLLQSFSKLACWLEWSMITIYDGIVKA